MSTPRLEDLLRPHPRVSLADLPTPLRCYPRLAEAIGLDELWVLHDDQTGLAMGGNKVRQLEFVLGHALAEGADTALITGAVQSNYVRCAAAACARLGLACHVQLEARVPRSDVGYVTGGNVLLDRLLGATVTHFPEGEDEAGADAALEAEAERLRAAGRRPYVIHLAPGPPPRGALGYVAAAGELMERAGQKTDPAHEQVFPALDRLDEIVVGSGSGHTHAGLLVGLRALGVSTRVCGGCVRRAATLQEPRIEERCREVEELLSVGRDAALNWVTSDDVVVDDAALAPGYGQLNEALREATALAAGRAGMLLDPVYTARSFATLIDRVRRGEASGRVLFVHTGGLPAVFAYGEEVLSSRPGRGR